MSNLGHPIGRSTQTIAVTKSVLQSSGGPQQRGLRHTSVSLKDPQVGPSTGQEVDALTLNMRRVRVKKGTLWIGEKAEEKAKEGGCRNHFSGSTPMPSSAMNAAPKGGNGQVRSTGRIPECRVDEAIVGPVKYPRAQIRQRRLKSRIQGFQ